MAEASLGLAWVSLGLALASQGLARGSNGLAEASQGLAWDSQGPAEASQGLAEASQGPQRLMTRKKSSRDPSRMLRFWPFFGRFMSPGSESKKLGLISKIKIDFTFFQYAVCWHNPFIFFVSCFFTSKFTV